MGQIRISDALLEEICDLYGKPVMRGFSKPIQALCAELRRLRIAVKEKGESL